MRNSFIYLLIFVAVIAIFFTMVRGFGGTEERSITDIVEWAREGLIQDIEVRGETVTVVRNGGKVQEPHQQRDRRTKSASRRGDRNRSGWRFRYF